MALRSFVNRLSRQPSQSLRYGRRGFMTDLEIARQANMTHINSIAEKLNLQEMDIEPYGHYKAKVNLSALKKKLEAEGGGKNGKLVLVTAINPTKAGEGKTTTTVGLGDALNKMGRQTTLALREPSLGPCFGMKGGAAGGGYAQVVPMEDINLHFNGDFHAIGLAHNLLSAAIDNHIHHGNSLGIDTRKVTWKRTVDLNDRSLRHITCGMGGVGQGYPRETGFDITAASEVMAIFCLSKDLADCKERLGNITIGQNYGKENVTAKDLNVHGAMAALLRDALNPNLVQTLENNPTFVHGGPFANIAHGCNSVIATKLALQLSDIVVTEAGFGADLGAQKFFDIKCRQAGLKPDLSIVVATTRALKLQGGCSYADIKKRMDKELARGCANLARNVESCQKYGTPVVVAINAFLGDSEQEYRIIRKEMKEWGLDVPVVTSAHWEHGSAGAMDLAKCVDEILAENPGPNEDFKVLYDDSLPLLEKAKVICKEIYGADDIQADAKLRKKFRRLDKQFGHLNLPVCMAKTQYSLSTDPALMGRPRNFDVPIRDVEVRSGAGFALVLTGDIMTMPGLPTVPAAEQIDVDDDGNIVGLF